MKIYQIEITNYCNFNCEYCPRDQMKRPLGIMTIQTLNHVLQKIENKTLRLHHYGESLLDDKLEEKIEYIKWRKPEMELILNTNGSLLTPERAISLFKAGLDKIILSCHNNKSLKYVDEIDEELRDKIEVIKMTDNESALDEIKKLGYKTSVKRLRDLGQIKKEKVLNDDPVNRCSFLKNNEVVVLWNGDIVPCCECYDDKVVLGNVEKDLCVKNISFDMCKTCLGYGNDNNETERKET